VDTGDLQYIAGFFDGEGSICITKSSSGRPKAGRYELKVSMVNTNRDVLLWIQAALGVGRIVVFKKPNVVKPVMSTRTCYCAVWSGRQAEKIISLLLPYLKVKRGEAEIALKFRETFEKGRWSTRRRPEPVMAQREAMRQHLALVRRPQLENVS
jgi:hypothetical protein